MAVRISKEVTDRVRECEYVLSAFQTEGSYIAETLTRLTQPHLEEGDEPPGYGTTLIGLSRNVGGAVEDLVKADSKLTAAVGWESTLRMEHQQKSEEQGADLIALRRTVIAQYVNPDLENLSLQALDARDAVTVARRSQLVSERFEAPNLAQMLGQLRFEEPVNLDPYVRRIQASATDLRDLGRRINKAERLTARARLEKKTLQEEHDKLVLRSARVLEDLCRLIGDDELADKIRRTVRSRANAPDPGNEEPGEVVDAVDDPVIEPAGETSPEGEETSREA